ncbi:hypothetical protein CAP36_08635 [Chitinophagaceae bacterium IBVUCB2]|nr:hypothetical protein CAP36_08635 [Chitinophagaceae bacterium IBVUCB2]
MKYLVILFAASAIFFTSCESKTATTEASSFNIDSVRIQIAASNIIFGSSFGKADSAAFAALYTTDGCMSPQGMPKICGATGITAFFNEGVKAGFKNIALTTEEVLGGKEGVIETGKYEVLGEGGVSYEKGKYIVMWKEENGKWKMHRDIWNSDTTPAPAAN